MEIEIIEEGAGRIPVLNTLPEAHEAPALTGATPRQLKGEKFTGIFQSFHRPGFGAWFNHYLARHPATVRARADIPVLELRVSMSRPLKGEWDKIHDPVLPPRCFNVYYTPFVDTTVWMEPGEYLSFDLHPDLDWLMALGVRHETLDRFTAAVMAGRPATLYKRPQPCGPDLKKQLFQLRHLGQHEAIRNGMISHRVSLLTLDALAPLLAPAKQGYQVPPRDRPGLNEALRLIGENLEKFPGCDWLSRKTGLNDLKLIKGFKAEFGKTPADYHQELRMERAMSRLLESDEPVNAIAWELGYVLSSSFSRAFRQHTGLTPQEFRDRRR